MELKGNAGHKKATMLLEEPISRLVPKMAVPTIIANLVTIVYNLADAYFVSALGTAATAAVGVNGALDRCITLVGSLLGAGAGSYIARLLGAKRKDDADRVLSTSIFTGLAAGIVILILGTLIGGNLVLWLGATEDCRVFSMQYARYVLIAAPFMIGSLILNMCLRNEGSATYSMVGIGIGGILNIALDPLFIFTFGLGVAGASIATAISKLVSFIILLFPYLKKHCSVTISLRRFKYVWKDIVEVVSIGSTSFLRMVGVVFSSIVLNHVAGNFSTAALAAMSLGNRIMEFPFSVILGFGGGFQPVVGFNWGAKRYDRVRESLRFGSIVSVIGAVVMGAIMFIFARRIINLFNSEADGEVLRLGMLCIRAQCITMVFHAWSSVINMFYAGTGKALLALLLGTARQFYCFIPLLLIVPQIFGVEGLATCLAFSDVITLVITIPTAIHAYRLVARADEDTLPAAQNG